MATIHCKACGKSYNYEKNGCCPECGAYNRPPRREQVYADGTVHHLDGSSRRPVPNGDKVCYERKENHQKKVCFEDQARQVREKLNSLSGPARQVSLVGVLVAGLIVLSLVSSIVSSCQVRHTDYSVDPVTPATQEPAVAQEWLYWDTWQGGRVGTKCTLPPAASMHSSVRAHSTAAASSTTPPPMLCRTASST